jgi:hypothetical protein
MLNHGWLVGQKQEFGGLLLVRTSGSSAHGIGRTGPCYHMSPHYSDLAITSGVSKL